MREGPLTGHTLRRARRVVLGIRDGPLAGNRTLGSRRLFAGLLFRLRPLDDLRDGSKASTSTLLVDLMQRMTRSTGSGTHSIFNATLVGCLFGRGRCRRAGAPRRRNRVRGKATVTGASIRAGGKATAAGAARTGGMFGIGHIASAVRARAGSGFSAARGRLWYLGLSSLFTSCEVLRGRWSGQSQIMCLPRWDEVLTLGAKFCLLGFESPS